MCIEIEYNIAVLNVRFPWINLILEGLKTIENRKQKLGVSYYCLYCPLESDWNTAVSNEGIKDDLQKLGLKPTDIKKFRGNILGLIEVEPAKQEHQSSIYWMTSFNHQYHVKSMYVATPSEYMKWSGSQGTKLLRKDTNEYKTAREWFQAMKKQQNTP